MVAKFTSSLITPRIINRVVTPVDPTQPPKNFKEGKFVIFVGGGRASGKSTIKEHLFNLLESEGYQREYVAEFGSDIFKDILNSPLVIRLRNLLDKQASAVASAKEGLLYKIANEVFRKARGIAFAQGSPLVFDYHMNNARLMEELIGEAKSHGYECIFISPHISADRIFERLELRKQRTGRPYNLRSALETHRDFAQMLPGYFAAFDVGIILDNNTDGASPHPIVLSQKGKLTIFDGEAYADVKRKTAINVDARKPEDVFLPGKGRAVQDLYSNSGAVEDGSRKGLRRGEEPVKSFASRLVGELIREDKQQR